MKGLVISNCGAMGLDWAALSMSGYLEAMAARSGDLSADAEPGYVHDRAWLLRFHNARRGVMNVH